MRGTILFLSLLVAVLGLNAQNSHNPSNLFQNSAEKLLATEGNLTIGGYGEVHYNQELDSDTKNNGELDVHRVVMLFGYHFNSRTQFITEIEFEHVNEVSIEQAFLQYRLNNYIQFRGGLLLIPMGIINEYHEPTTFNGVERPMIDKYIAPTTWREVGLGVTGNISPASLRYQLYLVNGFNSYNGKALLNGANGFRKGRQKGAESFISSPNFTGKIEYYGIRGLNLGVSGYFGQTQSPLYDGVGKNDNLALAIADSSVVGISMVGIDARYTTGGLQLRGQYYLTGVSNTLQYNRFTASNGVLNDLGKSMYGYYVEAGYNVLKFAASSDNQLITFVRLEEFDTHNQVDSSVTKNQNYSSSITTAGITYKLARGAVLKADIEFIKTAGESQTVKVFNAGFGVMF